MAEHEKDNDEYQFVDIESVTPSSVNEQGPAVGAPAAFGPSFQGKKNVKRNAFFVVLFVVIMMVVYSMMNVSPSTKSKEPSFTPAAVSVAKKNAAPIARQPEVVSQPLVKTEDHALVHINQKISALERSQQGMRAELSAANQQLSAVNGTINDMMTKVSELNQALAALVANMDAQSREISQLLAQKAEAKRGHQPRMASHPARPPTLRYAIQAVIPGRAWLIASNGSTLTVREGSMIAGYGVVKLIDSAQGRIITGSGQVIRFSQEDS
ncbi:MAG TPA: type IV secretion protein IcmG [Legionella sp.]|nr:type IV secretion protein IcmG [Legionella sp.]